MFLLARQLPPPVLVTATTHLGHDQLARADVYYTVGRPEDIPPPEVLSSTAVTLLVGPAVEGWRTSGLDQESYRQLSGYATAIGATLLVEADGSRQLPLKAPAEHEPPVPPDVDAVVVVAGMLGYQQPLQDQFVHRVERYAQLAGLQPGERISLPHMAKVLRHPLGGLKNIPTDSQRRLLLNQADTPFLQAAGGDLARTLLSEYQLAVVSALSVPGFDHNTPPAVFASFGKAAAVVLAAGAATRYGEPKQLLPWRGVPFVRAVAQTALQAGFQVIVVTGYQAERVSQAVQDLAVKIVHNPDWGSGQGSSVRAGVQSLPAGTQACIFLHSDQPQITRLLLLSLMETYYRQGSKILAPLVEGQRSTPVLFDHDTFHDLSKLEGDHGGRELFSRYPLDYLVWHEASLRMDVDTPEAYARLKEFE